MQNEYGPSRGGGGGGGGGGRDGVDCDRPLPACSSPGKLSPCLGAASSSDLVDNKYYEVPE